MPGRLPIKTLKENLSKHLERIGFGGLSRTFQDAVQVARGLQLSYLWIDSLCIVQDDTEDWIREAEQMANVYRESVCTISALSADGGDSGCRVNACGEPVEQLRYVDLDIGECRIRLVETEDNIGKQIRTWNLEYGDDDFKHRAWGNNPLRRRGWAFQERELSVRSIHFSKQTLLWECLEMKGSTEIPHSVIRRHDEFKPVPIRSPATEAEPHQIDCWYGKVEDYSSRFLTCESDKLIVIIGFARHFQRDTMGGSGTYLAGLWKEHFPGCLLWRVRADPDGMRSGEKHRFAAFEPRRPMGYRAPSWSWASLDGEVTWASQRLTTGGASTVPTDTKATTSISLIGLEPAASEFGFSRAPPNASLTVRGQLARLVFQYLLPKPHQPVDECKRPLYHTLGAVNGQQEDDVMGFFYPDIVLEVQDLAEVLCLAVCDEEYHTVDFDDEYGDPEQHRERVMGIALVLVAKTTAPGVFRRVGLIRWVRRAVFENLGEWEDVKIV